MQISMEHDNHTFKRTYPILKGEVNEKGIYYLGDGAWGVPARKPHKHWYLAKALRSNCYWHLSILPDRIEAKAYDGEGNLLDEVLISRP